MPVRGPAQLKLHRKEDAEILQVGAVTCFLLEDGTRTDNRIAAVIMSIPPGAKGPPMHWARMHDECFFVTQGTVRFTTTQGTVDAPQGSMMVAPPRASHSFENASETEEAEIYMTATPGEFIASSTTQARMFFVSTDTKITEQGTTSIVSLQGWKHFRP